MRGTARILPTCVVITKAIAEGQLKSTQQALTDAGVKATSQLVTWSSSSSCYLVLPIGAR